MNELIIPDEARPYIENGRVVITNNNELIENAIKSSVKILRDLKNTLKNIKNAPANQARIKLENIEKKIEYKNEEIGKSATGAGYKKKLRIEIEELEVEKDQILIFIENQQAAPILPQNNVQNQYVAPQNNNVPNQYVAPQNNNVPNQYVAPQNNHMQE